MLSHRYGIFMAASTIEGLRIGAEDCAYTVYPIYHMGAAFSEVLVAIIAGCRVAVRRRFSASRFWDEVRETRRHPVHDDGLRRAHPRERAALAGATSTTRPRSRGAVRCRATRRRSSGASA